MRVNRCVTLLLPLADGLLLTLMMLLEFLNEQSLMCDGESGQACVKLSELTLNAKGDHVDSVRASF